MSGADYYKKVTHTQQRAGGVSSHAHRTYTWTMDTKIKKKHISSNLHKKLIEVNEKTLTSHFRT
jgi:hypothetical protein